MIITKFDVGQKVFAVRPSFEQKRRRIHCDLCNSTGKVKIEGADILVECPNCHGHTEMYDANPFYYIAFENATIGKITVELYSEEYNYEGHLSKNSYMLKETGVGSGQVWREDRLFATEDEAHEFCNKYIPNCSSDTRAVLKPDHTQDNFDKLTENEFVEKYCNNCGTQRCEGIGTEWFDGCKFKNHLRK